MKFQIFIVVLVTISPVGGVTHRRILHQPLFPMSSDPPQPPPEDNGVEGSESDQPFFPEDPYGGAQYQAPPPPSQDRTMPISTTTTTTTRTRTAPTKTIQRAAIAISIGIAVLCILSALSFLAYKKRAKTPAGHSKRDPIINPNHPHFNVNETIAPPSSFLYMGTLEPHNQGSNRPNYTKKQDQDQYRASNVNLSSSEDETLDEIKHAIIPSIKKFPPPQEAPKLAPEKTIQSVFELQPSLPRRAKFGQPPPPANLALLYSQPPAPPQPVNEAPRVRSTWTNFIRKASESESESPSPPAPEGARKDGDGGRRSLERAKLRPLHWEKVRAASDRATVWDQMEPSTFPLNEDKMESLFGCNSNKWVKNEDHTKKPVFHPPVEKRVLDPKRSQNIAILLRALNVTRAEVTQALLDGNSEALGADLLETLAKMAPTKEEEIKLTNYNGDASKLGAPERFLKAVLDVPFAFKRVEAMLYRANFDVEVKYLRKSFQTLEDACDELKNSRLFLKILEAVLTTGNRMNIGTNRGDAQSFKLDTLLKLVDIKASDGKTTLLHFVVRELARSEGTEADTIGLSREISKVKLAAGMDSNVLHSNVTKLEVGLRKAMTVMEYEKEDTKGGFFESMKAFLGKAEEEIYKIKASERKALSLVREVTEYFHGEVGKEEQHPFRIFAIVKEFLSALDCVCKDPGPAQGGSVMGASRSFQISTNVRLPVVDRYNARRDDSSSEDSSSP